MSEMEDSFLPEILQWSKTIAAMNQLILTSSLTIFSCTSLIT